MKRERNWTKPIFYRAVHLDGVNMSGRPIISSSNMEYVRNYIDVHGYNRWLPHTLFMVNEHSFCCLTSSAETHARKLGNQMYGEYYYGLLLNLFFIKSCCLSCRTAIPRWT